MSQVSREQATTPLARALGRIPSGLFILTIRHDDDETGMLASWVQQCSFDPPQVVVAVNRKRFAHDWLTAETRFTVNILAEGQTSLLKHFAHSFPPGAAVFEGLETARGPDAATHLIAAHAYLECRVVSVADGGDHTLVIGRVHGGAVLHDAQPLVHVRKSGLYY